MIKKKTLSSRDLIAGSEGSSRDPAIKSRDDNFNLVNLRKTFIWVTGLMLLTGCSAYKPVKAPCTYNDRTNCGAVVPLQQSVVFKNNEKSV